MLITQRKVFVKNIHQSNLRPKVMLITQRKVIVKQTMLFDNCINKRSQNIKKNVIIILT